MDTSNYGPHCACMRKDPQLLTGNYKPARNRALVLSQTCGLQPGQKDPKRETIGVPFWCLWFPFKAALINVTGAGRLGAGTETAWAILLLSRIHPLANAFILRLSARVIQEPLFKG